MTGFQACCIESSLTLSKSTWSFSPENRQGQLELDFGVNSLGAGSTATVTYQAVPVLFRSDCATCLVGTRAPLDMRMQGVGRAEHWRTTTTRPVRGRRAGRWWTRCPMRFGRRITCWSPTRQSAERLPSDQRGHDPDEHGELATVRNGVLGYYHSIGATYTTTVNTA